MKKNNNEDDGYDEWYERWEYDDLTFDEIKEGYRKYYGEEHADMLVDESEEDDWVVNPLTYEERTRAIQREYRQQQWKRFWRNLRHDTVNVLIWGVFMAIAVAIAIWIKGE